MSRTSSTTRVEAYDQIQSGQSDIILLSTVPRSRFDDYREDGMRSGGLFILSSSPLHKGQQYGCSPNLWHQSFSCCSHAPTDQPHLAESRRPFQQAVRHRLCPRRQRHSAGSGDTYISGMYDRLVLRSERPLLVGEQVAQGFVVDLDV
jgi:hypothetical protein